MDNMKTNTAEHYVNIARKIWEGSRGRYDKAAAWRALRQSEDALARETRERVQGDPRGVEAES